MYSHHCHQLKTEQAFNVNLFKCNWHVVLLCKSAIFTSFSYLSMYSTLCCPIKFYDLLRSCEQQIIHQKRDAPLLVQRLSTVGESISMFIWHFWQKDLITQAKGHPFIFVIFACMVNNTSNCYKLCGMKLGGVHKNASNHLMNVNRSNYKHDVEGINAYFV